VVGVLLLGRFDGSNDVVVSVLELGVVVGVVEVSPGSMSVVTGGLVLVIVSVAVDEDDENEVRPPDVLGSR
jgi:hypothetical protein